MKRYGALNPWFALGRELGEGCRSRVGALWSQRRIEAGPRSRLASSVRVRGMGIVRLGRGVVVEAHVTFVAEKGGVVEIGDGAKIGAGSRLCARRDQRLEIGCEAVVETDVTVMSVAGLRTGQGSLIGAGTSIVCREPMGHGQFVMGCGAHLSTDNLIDLCGDVRFGDEVRTGPNCAFYTHKHTPKRPGLIWEQGVSTAAISVGNAVWIGHACQVMPGVAIGQSAVIGAGSVVTKPIPDWVIAAGTPARVLREVR